MYYSLMVEGKERMGHGLYGWQMRNALGELDLTFWGTLSSSTSWLAKMMSRYSGRQNQLFCGGSKVEEDG